MPRLEVQVDHLPKKQFIWLWLHYRAQISELDWHYSCRIKYDPRFTESCDPLPDEQ
jgi:hypothetical protein